MSSAAAPLPGPPLPADAVVDPRIGSHGPCLLALEGGTTFRGMSLGAPSADRGDLVNAQFIVRDDCVYLL